MQMELVVFGGEQNGDPSLSEEPGHGLRLHAMGLRWKRAVALSAALCWFAALALWHRNVIIDDPWISFHYARNLLEGNGLVLNPGERVEGYSNFLWVLLSAMPIRLGIDPLGAMQVVSWLCCAATFWLMALKLPWFEDREGGGFAGVFLLAGSFPFAVWAMGGLETSLYALLVLLVAAFSAAVDDRRGGWRTGILAGLALAVASMTRPEGAMFAAIPAGMLAWRARRGERVAAGRLALGLAVFGALFGAYLGWRLSYYGHLLPNSATAKLGGGAAATIRAGHAYLWSYFLGAQALVLVAAAWGFLRAWREEPSPLHLCCAGVCAMQVVFVLGVGGDWMPGYRFVVPMAAPLCLLAAHGLAQAPLVVRGVAVWFVLVASPVEAGLDKGGGPAIGLRFARWVCDRKPLVEPLVRIGTDLRVMGDPGDAIAMSEAGVVPYLSRLRLIDMLGLVDPEIAAKEGGLHQKFDAESVLRRRPRFILLGYAIVDGAERPAWASDAEMAAHPRFRQDYRPVHRWPRRMDRGDRVPTDGVMILFERLEAESPAP